jgi:4-amino-4-deoxy-L-arabinose transferase-like glycosyltransferase
LASGILFEVFYAFFRALIKPLEAYDAIAIYGIKAKAFFLANTLPQHFFDNSSFVFPHADYPLNMPLAETLTYFFLGGLNDQLVKVIFPLYFLAILTLVYFFMRRFAGRTYSLLFTFILATIPQFTAQSTSGYIDVPFGYYASAAMLLLFLWFKDAGQRGLLWLSALFAGLGAWTKNEGLMYCVINAVLLAIFFTLERRTVLPRKQFLYLAGYIGIMVLVNIPWFYVKGLRHLLNSEINLADLNPENIFHNAGRIWPITYEFQKQFLGPKKWNIIWILLAAAFVAKIRRAFTGELRYMSLAILLAFCGYTAVYLITLSDVSWHLSSAASRILLHFLPVAVCWLAVALKEEIRI